MFITLSVLEVTQRVPPTCITKTYVEQRRRCHCGGVACWTTIVCCGRKGKRLAQCQCCKYFLRCGWCLPPPVCGCTLLPNSPGGVRRRCRPFSVGETFDPRRETIWPDVLARVCAALAMVGGTLVVALVALVALVAVGGIWWHLVAFGGIGHFDM